MPAARRAQTPRWQDWPTERLLDVRMCDLEVDVPGTWLEALTGRIHEELSRKGLRIRPHFYLSDEWFCPKGIPGVAIPFYLAHPRLVRLERTMMLEVEGSTRQACLKLLRHETGHAVQNGYALHRKRRWQEVFGHSSRPYPEAYRPDPTTKKYVQHLDDWYAQCHPDEDFAETFALWLTPRSGWRRRYEGWPALGKLEYVDELMESLAGEKPKVTSKARPDRLSQQRKTLREFYAERQERHGVGFSDLYDRDLKKLFELPDPNLENGARPGEPASRFLRRNRKQIRTLISRWTGEYQYTLDEVLTEMIGRCRELGLRAVERERELLLDFCIMLSVHTAHHVFLRREWRTV